MKSDSVTTPPKRALAGEKHDFFDRHFYTLLAFLVPLGLMLLAFIKLKLYPFGDQQILVVDAWHQYFPFLKELRSKLISGDSLFWSWNIGGGTNFIALIAYYASSPFNLLSILCPVDYLTEFMAVMTLIKIALAGLTFSIFLRGMYRRQDLTTVAFSTAYALCAFSMGYYWTWMWLDGVALFPLIILGLNKLIDEGKYKMFTFSLALALISNYYIGAFICIFVALYYVVAYLSRFKLGDIRNLTKITCRVLIFSVIGVALSLIIVLPTYFALSHASAASNQFPSTWQVYKPWLDVFNDLLSGVSPNRQQMSGSVNIGCGMLSLILIFIYSFNKKIGIRERIANISLLIFIFLTFNINMLDFVFHGFHFPNELPHRYAFIFSFLLVASGYRAFISLRSVKDTHIIAVMLGLVGYILLINKMGSEAVSDEAVIISIILAIAYCLTFLIIIRNKGKQVALSFVILLLSVADGIVITQKSTTAVQSSSREGYRTGMADTEDLAYAMEDGSFFRVETNETFTINPGPLYGFRSISQFNSSANSRMVYLMDKLGLAGNMPSNRYSYFYGSPVFNSFFNLKYIINRTGSMDSEYLTYYKQSGNSFAYSYDYALPLGFMTKSELRQLNINKDDPFKVQNDMMSLATGMDKEVFTAVGLTKINDEDNLSMSESNGSLSFTQPDSGRQSYFELSYTAEKDGTAYIYLSIPKAVDSEARISISEDGVESSSVMYPTGYAHIIEIGSCKKGSVITVAATLEADCSAWGSVKSYVYQCDTEVLKEGCAILSKEALNIDSYTSDSINGTVTTENGGLLYTSIPWEEGWSAKVDGKEVKLTPMDEALLVLDLTPGTHSIELRYCPEGFKEGLIISGVALLIMILLIVLRRCKVKIPLYAYIMGETESDEYSDKYEVQLTGSDWDDEDPTEMKTVLYLLYKEESDCPQRYLCEPHLKADAETSDEETAVSSKNDDSQLAESEETTDSPSETSDIPQESSNADADTVDESTTATSDISENSDDPDNGGALDK